MQKGSEAKAWEGAHELDRTHVELPKLLKKVSPGIPGRGNSMHALNKYPGLAAGRSDVGPPKLSPGANQPSTSGLSQKCVQSWLLASTTDTDGLTGEAQDSANENDVMDDAALTMDVGSLRLQQLVVSPLLSTNLLVTILLRNKARHMLACESLGLT